jgi:hypothetical protein
MEGKNLSIAPTLFVLVAVLGLAFLVGIILLMMLVQTDIPHSPEQSMRHMTPPTVTRTVSAAGVKLSLHGEERA